MTNRDPVSSSWKGRSHGVLLDCVITCVQLQYIGIKEKGDVSYEKRGRQEYAERVTNNFLSFFFSLESDDRYKMGPRHRGECVLWTEDAAKCLQANKPGWKRKEIGKTSAVAAHNDDARRAMLDFGPEKTMRAGGSPRSNGTNFWAFSGLSTDWKI